MEPWWRSFFDADYLRIWGGFVSENRTRTEAEGLWRLLELRPGSRVLDAPCGYGRLSSLLAGMGADVTGVDQSEALLSEARKATCPGLRYVQHDLRQPLQVGEFDAAINVYSSLGYGSEDDDLAILATLCGAVRPGGLVFVETMHRDAAAARFSRGGAFSSRLPDGTLVIEEPHFDPIAGSANTCWYWSGPAGTGSKPARLRVYSATELVRLMEKAGLRFRSAYQGCSVEPFTGQGPDMGGRLGLLAERPA